MRGWRVLLLGAPGVGKGTYGKLLSRSLGLPLVNLGDVIRGEINSGSAVGAELRKFTSTGQLVPNTNALELIRTELGKCGKGGFILDGFPRTVQQAQALEDDLQQPVDLAVQLRLVRDEFLVAKMLGRRLCSSNRCGKSFNVTHVESSADGVFMPALLPDNCDRGAVAEGREPACECGAPLVCREDDTREVITQRIKVYHEETLRLLDFYQSRGLLEDFIIRRGLEDMPKLEQAIVEQLGTS